MDSTGHSEATVLTKRAKDILSRIAYKDWVLRGEQSKTGSVYIQVYFRGPCIADGEIEDHFGRRWMLTPSMSNSEIVQTALKAVLAAEEHEARERFLYRGRSVFGPHFDVETLHSLCKARTI